MTYYQMSVIYYEMISLVQSFNISEIDPLSFQWQLCDEYDGTVRKIL